MKAIYIVCRVSQSKSGVDLRAYATADGAHQKLEDILSGIVSGTPSPLLCLVKTQRTSDGKLYAIEADDTTWHIKTLELRA